MLCATSSVTASPLHRLCAPGVASAAASLLASAFVEPATRCAAELPRRLLSKLVPFGKINFHGLFFFFDRMPEVPFPRAIDASQNSSQNRERATNIA